MAEYRKKNNLKKVTNKVKKLPNPALVPNNDETKQLDLLQTAVSNEVNKQVSFIKIKMDCYSIAIATIVPKGFSFKSSKKRREEVVKFANKIFGEFTSPAR